jgi:hypothetical protein
MDSRRSSPVGLVLAGIVAVAAVAVIGGRLAADEAAADRPLELAAPSEVYDPVSAGEPLPTGFRQLLGRDQILPVYEPVFTEASRVDWPDDMLVIGVAGAEEAKAYPVTHLNRREMVVDSLEGIPILVTW